LLTFLAGCQSTGGESNGGDGGGSTTTGSLLLTMTDTPMDNLVKFEITVASITLGADNLEALPAPVDVELSSLQLTSQVIRLSSDIPTGSYSSVSIQFSNPQIKYCPESGGCSTSNLNEISPDLVHATVTKTISLSVTQDGNTGLLLDFDLAGSVQTDGVGNITRVDPQVTATVQNLGAQENEFEAKGRVASLTQDSSTTGSFLLEVFGSCQRITIDVDADTTFEDFDNDGLTNDFGSLAVNQIVKVEADARSSDPLLAKNVELEESTDIEEAEGTIIDGQRNAISGAVTQFTLLVQGVGTCASSVLTDDILTVTPDADTEVVVDENDLPGITVSLFNDRADLALGQKVEVEPVGGLLGATSFTAAKIRLSEQTVRGTVISTGATSFTMVPAPRLIADPQTLVETSDATEFENVSGVVGLPTNEPVRVRGLLFFNIVTGQYSIIARKVWVAPTS
jgi:hypothetical protein